MIRLFITNKRIHMLLLNDPVSATFPLCSLVFRRIILHITTDFTIFSVLLSNKACADFPSVIGIFIHKFVLVSEDICDIVAFLKKALVSKALRRFYAQKRDKFSPVLCGQVCFQ